MIAIIAYMKHLGMWRDHPSRHDHPKCDATTPAGSPAKGQWMFMLAEFHCIYIVMHTNGIFEVDKFSLKIIFRKTSFAYLIPEQNKSKLT